MKGHPQPAADLGLATAAAGVLIAGTLWAGGASAAWLTHGHVPHGRMWAGLAALGHLADPSAAWHAPVGPPAIYWACVLVAVAAAAAVAWGGWRLWHHDPAPSTHRLGRYLPGTATRTQVRRVAGAAQLRRRAETLRPTSNTTAPEELGFRLGTSRGVPCWTSVEDSLVVVGPARSGKGMNLVIPAILDAPGPTVTTSTRPDNLTVTVDARRRRGPVCIFDPENLCDGLRLPESRRWSLLRGCTTPEVAMARAEVLVPDAGGMENSNFWRDQALTVVQTLLHAAALGDKTAVDCYRWSHTAGSAKEALAILQAHPDTITGWDRALDAVMSADERTRDAVWAMVANTFRPLAVPHIAAAVTPDPGQDLDPEAFLADSSTLYLLATPSGATSTARIAAALIEDVVTTVRRLAAAAPGQRLDPPLALILDEAANFPLPSLPGLVSEGGGTGITTMAILQSPAQAEDRWGRAAARAIWSTSTAKIVLGGLADADDLAALSRLIGDHDTDEHSTTRRGLGADISTSVATRRRPILEPADIRLLPLGTAILLLRAAPAVILRLRPWTARPDADQLDAARRRIQPAADAKPGTPVAPSHSKAAP